MANRRSRRLLGLASVCWLGVRLGGRRPSAQLRGGRHLASVPVAAPQSPIVAGLLRRVRSCDNGAQAAKAGRPFLIGGKPLGLVLPQAARELERFPEVFRVTDAAIELVAAGASVKERSAAVAEVLAQLRHDRSVPMLQGWRDEGWPVKASFHSPVELVVERAAGPLFGVPGYGCHINGLVYSDGPDRPPKLWVARRAATKPTYPGKLDHVVAGGLGHGEKPRDNVLKECQEEAGIPAELAAQARSAGLVSYAQVDETRWGVKQDVILCYDLVLPPDFVPEAQDGEVESFALWDMQQVIDSLVDDNEDWKPNACLVIADLLVRRGFLAPEEAGYVDLVHALRR